MAEDVYWEGVRRGMAQPTVSIIEDIAAQQGLSVETLHASSIITKVKLDDLNIDRDYQREPTQRLVDDIADNYDEVSAEALLIADRGERPEGGEVKGGLHIVNGQHRALGARKKGETEVWARVLDLRSAKDPAAIEAMFRLRTNKRMGDKPLERFKAQVRSGFPESLAIVKILTEFNTVINETPNGETGINAVSTIERIYRVDEAGGLLREVLEVLRDAWREVGGKRASAAMLAATAWFIVKHSDESDRDRLVEKLKDLGEPAIDRRSRAIQATMAGTTWLNYYRAIVDFYNEKLPEKSRLEWRTSGSSSFRGGTGQWGRGES